MLINTPTISLRKASSFTWCTLSWIANFRAKKRFWLIPLNPNYSGYRALSKSEALALFSNDEKKDLTDFLKEVFGISGIEYCVLGVRDGHFYNDAEIRTSELDEYLPTINHLLDLGIPVIRMGRRVKNPLPISHPLLFDYPYSSYANDRMDVILWAHANFAFGDSTGLTDAVALLGSPIFIATHPLDPRSFVNSPNVFFATQRLVKGDSFYLKINHILEIMNTGMNLGDEKTLQKLGIRSEHLSPQEIKTATDWFLRVAVNLDQSEISRSRLARATFTEFLHHYDLDRFRHYRKDAFYSNSWLSMESTIYPESVNILFG